MAPLLLVWGMYFLWRGLSSGVCGISRKCDFWGLGFYTYIAFRVMPLMLVLVLLAYWHAAKKDFGHENMSLPAINFYADWLFPNNSYFSSLTNCLLFLTHPADFLGRTGQLSIFTSSDPLQALAENTYKTLGMFNFVGDHNWRHNLSGSPLLLWPVGVFSCSASRSWIKLFKRAKTHGI